MNKKLSLLPLLFLLLVSCNNPVDNKDTISFNVVAINDFHGAIEEKDGSMGLAKIGTYLKKRGQEANTLTLDQGDDWQGSIYSNYNKGKLVNDVFAEAKMSARTIGNHDFDWGLEPIKENTAREYEGYKLPVLAANVYDYTFETKTEGDIQQADIGQKSIVYTLENGLKVGVVGVIGKNQITSITSTYVRDICFKDHVQVMKDVAKELRNEEKCDVVIGCVHADKKDVMNERLNECLDLVLCGHSHQYSLAREGNLLFAQFGSNGEMIGDISLKYDKKQKKVVDAQVEVIDPSNINEKINKVDENIQNIINTYNQECDEESSEVLANNVPYYFYRYGAAPNMMCKAIYDEAIKEGYDDIVLSFTNESRENLTNNNNQVTYANLYEAFPFDNIVYIVEISGYDMLHEIVNYNNVCLNPTFDGVVNINSKYKIAVIDFLIFHTNAYRNYDYFSSFDGAVLGQLNNNYRIILKEWLINNGYNNGKELNAFKQFDSSLPSFDKSIIREG